MTLLGRVGRVLTSSILISSSHYEELQFLKALVCNFSKLKNCF
jgi:hypothetical protein